MAIKINLELALKKEFTQVKLKKASLASAIEMDRLKNEKTRKFKSPAKGGTWINIYNKAYAKRQGKSVNSVNLRRNKPTRNSIEYTTVKNKGRSGFIEFKGQSDGKKKRPMSEIFQIHQTGGPKMPRRQIYPDNFNEVPKSVIDAAIKELLK